MNKVKLSSMYGVFADRVIAFKEIIDYVSENFCDKYCKYPYLSLNQETLDSICEHCCMNKLKGVFEDEENICNN